MRNVWSQARLLCPDHWTAFPRRDGWIFLEFHLILSVVETVYRLWASKWVVVSFLSQSESLVMKMSGYFQLNNKIEQTKSSHIWQKRDSKSYPLCCKNICIISDTYIISDRCFEKHIIRLLRFYCLCFRGINWFSLRTPLLWIAYNFMNECRTSPKMSLVITLWLYNEEPPQDL